MDVLVFVAAIVGLLSGGIPRGGKGGGDDCDPCMGA